MKQLHDIDGHPLPFKFPEAGDPEPGLCLECLDAPSGTFHRVHKDAVSIDPETSVVKLEKVCAGCQHPAHPRYRCFVSRPTDPPHTFCNCSVNA